VKQNLFRLQRFDVDVFGGHLTGQLYFNARPDGWKIGLLSRISHVDARQMLPKDSLLKNSPLSPISARTALEFDINKRLIEGRINITEISREQLLQLLDIIDPDHQDEQIARVRTALRVAYPESVTVDMKQSLMDLEVTISALPKPIQVRGLPLTPLIQHFGGGALDALQKIPLQ
jgi:uncharacterized protein involved in outer membrane biogenesis